MSQSKSEKYSTTMCPPPLSVVSSKASVSTKSRFILSYFLFRFALALCFKIDRSTSADILSPSGPPSISQVSLLTYCHHMAPKYIPSISVDILSPSGPQVYPKYIPSISQVYPKYICWHIVTNQILILSALNSIGPWFVDWHVQCALCTTFLIWFADNSRWRLRWWSTSWRSRSADPANRWEGRVSVSSSTHPPTHSS